MQNERRPDGGGAGRSFDDTNRARRFQRKLRDTGGADRYSAGPTIEYDESGYPLEERKTTLAGRLRRLITG